MSGYQETLTDPSYHRQIVVATAPQIGNTGWNDEDDESRGGKIWVAGYAVRDPSNRVSNWRASGTLDDALKAQHVVGIAGIDTRAVVRHLRTRGSMKAGIFSGTVADAPTDFLLSRVNGQPAMLGADLAGEVSTASTYTVEPDGAHRFTVAPWTWASRPTHRAISRDVASACRWCPPRSARMSYSHSRPTVSSCPTVREIRPPRIMSSR